MATVIKDMVTWLKQWFYTEDEVDTITGGLQTQINNKADSTTVSALSTTVDGKANTVHNHGNLQSDGKVGTSNNASKNVVTDSSGNITVEDKYSHPSSHATTMIKESSALNNIGTNANATQHTINDAINTAIGSLQSINAIQVVDSKPTASASTMGKLYIISENNKVNVYYTKESGTSPNFTYSWQKMDTDILDELSIDWADIQNKPTSFTPESHAHGQVTNDGKITSTAVSVASADNIIITDASDSSKIKRVANLLASHVKDGTAHSNIGSSANDTQATINTKIDTALSNKANKTEALGTTITLIDKGETNEGCIIFNTIS